jgi:hypothetical protein
VKADAILAEMQAQRDVLERLAAAVERLAARAPATGLAALVAGIEEYFGDGCWTASGVLEVARDDPHGEVAAALTALGLATAIGLGRALRRAESDGLVECVGDRRGVLLWRAAGISPQSPQA